MKKLAELMRDEEGWKTSVNSTMLLIIPVLLNIFGFIFKIGGSVQIN